MTKELTPVRTVVTSFHQPTTLKPSPDGHGESTIQDVYEQGDWVVHLSENVQESYLACGLTNGSLQIYDRQRLETTQHVYKEIHTALTDVSHSGPHTLVTSGTDGCISLLDLRQRDKVQRMSLPRKGEQALSVSLGYDGLLAATGSSAGFVHFHDLRQNVVLGSYRDAHTEEVTRVRFQPDGKNGTTSLLVSASEDGLACVFDTTQPNEEMALQSVLTVGTSLRQVGFFGPSFEGVYCLTGSETLSVWHHDSAQRICDFGSDLREELSRLTDSPIDYLVDCHWDIRQQRLSLLTGNSAGDLAAVFQVNAGRISLEHTLRGGHRGVVRTWSCNDVAGTFLTGGEDARICEWNQQQQTTSATTIVTPHRLRNNAARGRRPVRRQKKHNPASPY